MKESEPGLRIRQPNIRVKNRTILMMKIHHEIKLIKKNARVKENRRKYRTSNK